MDCLHGLVQAHCAICNPAPKQPRPVEVRAAVLEKWIPALNGDPVSAAELADVSGLTVAQLYEAIGFLRDTYPDLPLVSDGRGYRWSMDREDIDRYRAARARTALTQVRRSWSGVVKPYLEQTGDTSITRLIAKQYERLLEDIEDLIA
jgi:hypothetical protein